jgi:hypothetical protein
VSSAAASVANAPPVVFGGTGDGAPEGPTVIWTYNGTGPAVIESVYCLLTWAQPDNEAVQDLLTLSIVTQAGSVMFAASTNNINIDKDTALIGGETIGEVTWTRGGGAVAELDQTILTEITAVSATPARYMAMTPPLPDFAISPGDYVQLYRIGSIPTALTVGPITVTYTPAEEASITDLAAGPFMLVPGPGA